MKVLDTGIRYTIAVYISVFFFVVVVSFLKICPTCPSILIIIRRRRRGKGKYVLHGPTLTFLSTLCPQACIDHTSQRNKSEINKNKSST